MSRTSTRLADVTEVITKGTTPTTLGYEFAETGVPFLRVQNIDGGSVNYERDTLFIDERTHCALKRSQIKPGDVLVSIAGTIGRAGLVPDNAPPLNCNQAVAIVRPTEQIFRPFLRLWLESSDAQKQMRGATVRGTISNLSLTQVGDLEIPLPPLAEQRRIAEVLDRAEALRAKRRAALAQLDSLTQSLFLDLFGDPATNPKRWPDKQLGDVIFSASDGPHVSPEYVEAGVPFLSTRHVRPTGIIWEDLKYISEDEAQIHWKKCKPERGDILYTKGGTTGIAKVVDFDTPVAIWVHIALLKTDKSKVEPLWLEAMLNTPYCYQQSQRFTRGIANHDLGLTRMVKIKIYLPPLSLQREFARRVGAAEKLKTTQRASLAELDALFATFQHRAFRGELWDDIA